MFTGNCIGGATSFNLGMYIEEQPKWIVDNFGAGFGTEDEVAGAYEWVSQFGRPSDSDYPCLRCCRLLIVKHTTFFEKISSTLTNLFRGKTPLSGLGTGTRGRTGNRTGRIGHKCLHTVSNHHL